jgi:hypothetical protein
MQSRNLKSQKPKHRSYNQYGKVICLYPVEVQYDVQDDKADEDSSAGFVKNTKHLPRKTIAENYCYHLIDEEQQKNRIQNFKSGISFHNQLLAERLFYS